jgi:predicted RNA binding protein YcfA (HicA-like mRNA interferase family)
LGKSATFTKIIDSLYLVHALYVLWMQVRQLLRLLHADGWRTVATRGSHRQLKHPSKPGRVTVAGKAGDDLAIGTLKSILKQAGLNR